MAGKAMAESKPAAAAPAAAGPAAAKQTAPKKGKAKLFILIGLAAVLLAGGAGAFLLRGKSAAADAKKAEVRKLPYFVEFENFTVNLRDTDRYLQIRLSFEVKSVDAAEVIKDLMPVVRSAVIPVLGSQDSNELLQAEGKQKLSKDIVVAANKSLEHTAAENSVDAVLITHMIIQ
jgi:flagellar FliL protein